MNAKDQARGSQPNATTRWEAAKDRVKQFIRSAPLKSDLWIAVFSSKPVHIDQRAFATEQDRQDLLELIDRYPAPTQDDGTALYFTLGKVLQLARTLSDNHKGRYVSVLLFSDGKDEHSPADWTRQRLEAMFHDAVTTNDNLWMFIAAIGEQGVKPEDVAKGDHVAAIPFLKFPLSIELAPTSVRLKNAQKYPKQSLQLELVATLDTWKRLGRTTLSWRWISCRSRSRN
jgi:hypothetical protein